MDDKLFQELVNSMEEFNKAAKDQQQLKVAQERLAKAYLAQLKKEQNRDKS